MPPNKREKAGFVLAGSAVALFVGSFILAFWSGAEETFYGTPTVFDGVLNVGVGSVLIFCWACWTAALVFFVIRRRIAVLALLGLLVPAISTFLLYVTVVGYIEDRIAFTKMLAEEPPNQRLQLTGDARE